MYTYDNWDGRIILATDNVLEQYQSTIYAFFQGSGQIFVGGIIWSTEGKWIVSNINYLECGKIILGLI